MLVLTRKVGQRVFIGEDIVVTVTRIDKDKDTVSLGFDAPKEVATGGASGGHFAKDM